MVVQCPGCKTSYRVPMDKVSESSAELCCSRCGARFPVDQAVAPECVEPEVTLDRADEVGSASTESGESDAVGDAAAAAADARRAAEAAEAAAAAAAAAESVEEVRKLTAEAKQAAEEALRAARAATEAAESEPEPTAPLRRVVDEPTNEIIDPREVELEVLSSDRGSPRPAAEAPPVPVNEPELASTGPMSLPTDLLAELDPEISSGVQNKNRLLAVLSIGVFVIVGGALLYFMLANQSADTAESTGFDPVVIDFALEPLSDGRDKVLIVRGQVLNVSPSTKRSVRARVQVLEGATLVASDEATCGHVFSATEIGGFDRAALDASLSRLEQGDTQVRPGNSLACSVVIRRPPTGFSRTRHHVEMFVLSSETVVPVGP